MAIESQRAGRAVGVEELTRSGLLRRGARDVRARADQVVPTGIAVLDGILPGGGVPCGYITELAGPASCGKLGIATRALAANQGLYNGFLAAGLIWSLYAGFAAQVFFLMCVIVAGIFGAITAKRTILWIQAMPAVIALSVGRTGVGQAPASWPSGPIRYLWKFQRGVPPSPSCAATQR